MPSIRDKNMDQATFSMYDLTTKKRTTVTIVSNEVLKKLNSMSSFLCGEIVLDTSGKSFRLEFKFPHDLKERFKYLRLSDKVLSEVQRIAFKYIVRKKIEDRRTLNYLAGVYYGIDFLKNYSLSNHSVIEFQAVLDGIESLNDLLLYLSMGIEGNKAMLYQVIGTLVSYCTRDQVDQLLIEDTNGEQSSKVLDLIDRIHRYNEKNPSNKFILSQHLLLQSNQFVIKCSRDTAKDMFRLLRRMASLLDVKVVQFDDCHKTTFELVRLFSKKQPHIETLSLDGLQIPEAELLSIYMMLLEYHQIKNLSLQNCPISAQTLKVLRRGEGEAGNSTSNPHMSDSFFENSGPKIIEKNSFASLVSLDLSHNQWAFDEELISEILKIRAMHQGMRVLTDQEERIEEFYRRGLEGSSEPIKQSTLVVEHKCLVITADDNLASQVTKLQNQEIVSVLVDCPLSAESERAVASLLDRNKAIHELTFTCLTCHSLRAVSKSIARSTLKKLSIEFQDNHNADDQFDSLIALLNEPLLKLDELCLKRVFIKQEQYEYLLKHLKFIRLLAIEDMKISSKAVSAIVQHLEGSLSFISSLSLRDARIGDEAFRNILELCKKSRSLKRIDLSYNQIGVLGVKYLLSFLENRSQIQIEKLTLEGIDLKQFAPKIQEQLARLQAEKSAFTLKL